MALSINPRRSNTGTILSPIDDLSQRNSSITTTTSNQVQDPNLTSESVKKKRKNKKKKNSEKEQVEEETENMEALGLVRLTPPFTHSSSLQKQIKKLYDEIVKCHHSKTLKLSQIMELATCLVKANDLLLIRDNALKKRRAIANVLVNTADDSSEGLRRHKASYEVQVKCNRLVEDTALFNWVVHHLDRTPAFHKMMEVAISMEKQKSSKLETEEDDEFSEIPFEELLEQEKKDAFWQKVAESRQCSSSGNR